jgi:hypothetical protein
LADASLPLNYVVPAIPTAELVSRIQFHHSLVAQLGQFLELEHERTDFLANLDLGPASRPADPGRPGHRPSAGGV